MTEILKGKPVADAIDQRSIETIQSGHLSPVLALFRVGKKKDDLSYERGIEKKADKLGIRVIKHVLSEDVSEDEICEKLKQADQDKEVDGIMIFRPLAKRFNDERIRNCISPEKDIDGCSELSLASLFTNNKKGFAPCTPQSVIEILDHYQIPIESKNVVIIGRSLVIGKPVSMLLLNRNATVTICHRKTKDLEKIASKADILVCAAGEKKMIIKGYTHPDQVVIDVGINWDEENQKLCGDVCYEDVKDFVRAITPVPGGVGSTTTSILLSHVAEAAKRNSK